jgi:NAD(P)-dependent dehydrogenase (short-subunit alcohol dehydrogenase family)
MAGPVDILANNAGVYKFRRHRRDRPRVFDRHINLNLRAPYILVQKLEPGMAERGRGVVVNLSTVAAGGGGIYRVSNGNG